MDWSIHFLSGQKNFRRSNGDLVTLTKNPVTNKNAHAHLKNHPAGLNETVIEFNNLLQYQKDLTSLYPVPLKAIMASDILELPVLGQNIDKIYQFSKLDYINTLEFLHKNGSKIIFIEVDKNLSVFFDTNLRSETASAKVPGKTIRTIQEQNDEIDLIYFDQSTPIWEAQGLIEIWDLRERRALDTRPLQPLYHSINMSVPHYWISSQNWWYNGVSLIQDIMAWLGLKVHQDLLAQWEPIYREWQSVLFKQLQFQYNYEHIVKCIVNNQSFEIDLTFEQEVVIQHCLIYQYNLNLKTWNLKKFPNNTKDLHKLLEPNIHQLG
jgi:hypothetical protein